MDNIDKARALGWLDENDICILPDDVIAVCSGYRARGGIKPWKMTEAQLAEAIKRGWILFSDGNADYHTFEQYTAKYADYPDPVFMLEQNDRWPPKKPFVVGGA